MKTLKFILVPLRILAWIAVTGVFYAVVLKFPANPAVTWPAAVLLFFLCYAITPRIKFMERSP